jgi:hypothetical protein
MVKTVIEMPRVSQCGVEGCVYNSQKRCHEKAITVGDFLSPECDTYLPGSGHVTQIKTDAGVGACKVIGCEFNTDYECSRNEVQLGHQEGMVRCLSYQER